MKIKEKTMKNKKNIDLTTGPFYKKMILFALPIAFSSTLQQLFNATDVAVVGKFAGSIALAAVGANGALISICVTMLGGLSIGANVVIANLIGQKKTEKVNDVVHTAICFSLIIGILYSILGITLASPVLKLIGTPDNVLAQATIYFQIYCLGMPFISLYNFGSAILRSIGDTQRPLIALSVAGVINILLNLILVIFFHMGVAGVGIATVISNVISSFIVITLLKKEVGFLKLTLKKIRIDPQILQRIIAIGGPAALQGMVFSLSNIFIQSGINSFGSDAVAGSSAGLNYEYVTYYVINAFNQTTVTFTGQNFGAGKHDNCKKVLITGLISGLSITAVLSFFFVTFATPLAYVFTDEAAVVAYAVMRMRHVMALEALTGTYEIVGASLRGRGISLTPAILTIIGSVCFRIFWLYTVFANHHTFITLMIVYPISWILTGTMVAIAYFHHKKKGFC